MTQTTDTPIREQIIEIYDATLDKRRSWTSSEVDNYIATQMMKLIDSIVTELVDSLSKKATPEYVQDMCLSRNELIEWMKSVLNQRYADMKGEKQ